MKPLTGSITGRMLLASLVLLPVFLGVMGLYLERSFQASIEASQAERMQLQVLTLLAEAEYEQELLMPQQLLEARFNQPDSGLYAVVATDAGERLWSSPSTLALDLGPPVLTSPALATGQKSFKRFDDLFRYTYAVLWQTDTGSEISLLFTVLETAAPLQAQLSSYRRSLWLWLGGSAVLLVLCQGLILVWGLGPLRQMAEDIADIESGESDELGGRYPSEVQRVTDNLNSLLHSEKQRRERARNTLSDLAHSLKTPLAIIRSANPGDAEFVELAQSQADQMDRIVAYQLQRASSGTHKLLQRVPVAPIALRLRTSLLKVHQEKYLEITVDIAPDCCFRGDERDLMEVLGNLMDNACKYSRSRVRVSATGGDTRKLNIAVEDDGMGIVEPLRQQILQRGVRADTIHQGQGIGLAVATDIVSSYGGTLRVVDSILGGACVSLEFG